MYLDWAKSWPLVVAKSVARAVAVATQLLHMKQSQSGCAWSAVGCALRMRSLKTTFSEQINCYCCFCCLVWCHYCWRHFSLFIVRFLAIRANLREDSEQKEASCASIFIEQLVQISEYFLLLAGLLFVSFRFDSIRFAWFHFIQRHWSNHITKIYKLSLIT